jgi:hypothetical protein
MYKPKEKNNEGMDCQILVGARWLLIFVAAADWPPL